MTPEVFWSKVDTSGGPDACWPWLGGVHHSGYGVTHHEGKQWRANRLAFLFAKGPIPDGLIICHACDRPLCCNPAHLTAGTTSDNAKDREHRGRAVIPGANAARLQKGLCARGFQLPHTKIDHAMASAILADYQRGGTTQKALAAKYHLGQAQIWRVVSGNHPALRSCQAQEKA